MKSPLWFVVAVLVAVGGIAGAVLDLLPRLAAAGSALTQVTMPGSQTLTLKEVGGYTIYRETSAAGLRLSLASPSGAAVPLQASNGSSTYSIGGRDGTSIFTFTVTEPGAYRLTGTLAEGRSEPKVVLGVEHGLLARMFQAILRAMAIAVAGFAIAGIIVGVTIWQRMKTKGSPT